MDKIIEYNHDDMDVVVQPGLCWSDLNEEVKKQGSDLFFPIDPGKSASSFARASSLPRATRDE